MFTLFSFPSFNSESKIETPGWNEFYSCREKKIISVKYIHFFSTHVLCFSSFNGCDPEDVYVFFRNFTLKIQRSHYWCIIFGRNMNTSSKFHVAHRTYLHKMVTFSNFHWKKLIPCHSLYANFKTTKNESYNITLNGLLLLLFAVTIVILFRVHRAFTDTTLPGCIYINQFEAHLFWRLC